MKNQLQFQGDIAVVPLGPTATYGSRFMNAGTADQPEKTKSGGLILHEGEKGGHFHVLEGDVKSIKRAHTNEAIKGWNVTIGDKGAKLRHVDPKGKDTREHGTLTLEPGTVYIGTQREALGENQFTMVTD